MIAGPVSAIASAVFVVLAAYGLGIPFGRALPDTLTPAERQAIRFLGGTGVLGLAIFLVGTVSFARVTILVLLVVPAALGAWAAARARPAGGWRRSVPWSVPLAFTIGILVLLSVASLSPMAGDFGHDAISYHVLLPALSLRAGKLVIALEEARTAFPATIEMIFGAGMALSNDRAARLLGVPFAAAVLIQVYGLARRLGSPASHAMLAPALVAAMPLVMYFVTEAFIDVAYATYALAVIRLGLDVKRWREGLVVGVFLGFALASKYTAFLLAIATPPLLIAFGNPILNWRQRVAWLVPACFVAVLIAAPWYLRTFLLVGSPIYPPPPGLSSIVQTPFMSPEAVAGAQHHAVDRGSGVGRGLIAFLALPFTFTFSTAAFHGGEGFGIAPLALAPVALIALARDRFARGLALWCLALIVLWFVTMQEARYMTHVLICAGAFAACGAGVLVSRRERSVRMAALAAVWLSVAYGGLTLAKRHAGSIAAVFSREAADRRWQARVDHPDAYAFLKTAPGVRRILIPDVHIAPYFLDRPYTKLLGGFAETPIPGVTTVDQALRHRPALDVSHVLVLKSTAERQGLYADSRLELLFNGATAAVFRVRSAEGRDGLPAPTRSDSSGRVPRG